MQYEVLTLFLLATITYSAFAQVDIKAQKTAGGNGYGCAIKNMFN